MLLLKFFDYTRKYNADSPGFVEARWILKRGPYSQPVASVLKLRAKAKSLSTIAAHEHITQERVRQLLIQGANQARERTLRGER